MSDEAREDRAAGLVSSAASVKEKAGEGQATAADVSAALKLLAHMGGELKQSHPDVVATRDEVMDSIGDLLVQGLELDRVLLYRMDPGCEQLTLEREFYHPSVADQVDRTHLQVNIPLRDDAGVTARCALERRPENVSDPARHPLINQDLARHIGINPFAVAPMVFRGELLGVLGVDRKLHLGVIDEDAFQVLIAFAD